MTFLISLRYRQLDSLLQFQNVQNLITLHSHGSRHSNELAMNDDIYIFSAYSDHRVDLDVHYANHFN